MLKRLSLLINTKSYKRIIPAPSAEVLATDWLEVVNPGNAKKVLYLAVKYDYGNPIRGLSYEEHNFFNTLKNMPNVTLIRVDIYTLYYRYGARIASEVIREVCIQNGIDTLFYLLYLDVFDHKMFKSLSTEYGIETILWLFDDDKRYQETKDLTNQFDKVVTTIEERHKWRLENKINSHYAQFAANHYLFRSYGLSRDIDILFIGQKFGNREAYVNHLIANGISVKAYGMGWSGGRVGQSDMLSLLNQAKIVLNFSSSFGHPELKFVKGRVFEIPATGAFLLTEVCEDLENYFTVGKDIDVFNDETELLNKVKYYLDNNDARLKVAESGKERVLDNFTFEHYLCEVLNV